MKIYIQIGDGKRSYPVKASTSKPNEPLSTGAGLSKRYIPTITFAINANFDRSIFKDSIKSIADFELTQDIIQSPTPMVDVVEINH